MRDGEGRVREQRRAGRVELSSYDTAGRRLTATDAQGSVTRYFYDAAGRLEREEGPASAIARYTYGPGDERLSSTDREGIVTTYTYDDRLRLRTESNAMSQTMRYDYDNRDLRIQMERAESPEQIWQYSYDLGRRSISVTDPQNDTTVYEYDAVNNRTAMVRPGAQRTEYDYDDQNRLIGVRHPQGHVETFVVDAQGNRTRWTRENAQVIEYDFDGLNRNVQTRIVPAADDGLSKVERSYDGNGNLLTATETRNGTSKTWSASYDAFNRRFQWTDVNGVTHTQSFDALDNRTGRSGPEGNTVYTYNALSHLTSVTPPNRPPVSMTVSPAGRLLAIDHNNGVVTQVSRDPAGRVTGLAHKLGASALLLLSYTLDANGNRTAEVWQRGSERVEIGYTLDLAERLTSITTDGQTRSYTLDQRGNRTQEQSPSETLVHTYDERDRLIQTQRNGSPQASYSYDAAGRQTRKTEGGVSWDYVYDANDRLIEVRQGGTTIVKYEVDAFGQRRQREASGQIERYHWDGTRLASISNAVGNTLADYQHAYSWPIASKEGSNSRTLLTDRHGTVQMLLDTGAIVGHTRSDVWGVDRAQSGEQSRLGHTGYLKDPLLDQLYAQARQYTPGIGRFTSTDPWTGDAMNPVTLNKYLAFNGNPGSFLDPDGRCASAPVVCAFGFARSEEEKTTVLRNFANENPTRGRTVGAVVRIGQGVTAPISAADTLASAVAGDSAAQTAVANSASTVAEYLTQRTKTLVTEGIGELLRQDVTAFATGLGENAGEVAVAGRRRDYVGQGMAGVDLAGQMAAVVPVLRATSIARANVARAGIEGTTPIRLAEAPEGGVGAQIDAELNVGFDAASDRTISLPSVSSKVSPDVDQIDRLMARFGLRALRESGGDFRLSESKFERYASALDARLQGTRSPYRIEFQPAAIPGEGRVPNFIHLHHGGSSSPLISDAQGNPRLFAYPGSRRLDAGLIDLRDAPNADDLRPVISGYDITLDANKRAIGDYYREAFGDINIQDIRR